ncbi:helix-turn-helix domain-containing protein [Kiloniella spongiae]|uniref:helix-turn-helix domain-containing protein n=1 Tax=Kiloniella spongiae TaxID=1489064 RepID=UPI00138E0D57|nr:helix-turn-helix domain-containing protein [Kiloniella spongiae]
MPESRENTSGVDTSENNQPTITVAEILRTGREKRGQDLRSVANILRIRYVFLEAIERGDFASLPGDTYAYGFVRTYAGYLNLDKDEIVRQFKQEVQNYGDRKQLVFPTPVPESKTPGLAILLMSIVLLGVAYGGWTAISRFDVDISEWVPFLSENKADTAVEDPVDENVSATDTVDVASTAEESASEADSDVESSVATIDAASVNSVQDSDSSTSEEAVTNDASEVQSQSVPETPEVVSTTTVPEAVAVETQPQTVPEVPEVSLTGNAEQGDVAVSDIAAEDLTSEDIANENTSEADQVSAETSVAAVTPPPPPEPEVFGDEVEDSPISIHAERDTWMHIVNGSGEAIFSRVLRAGSVYNVPKRDDLVMATGNAGGITIKLNGNDLPKLGSLGAVRRDIVLSEEGLLESITAE